MKYSQDFKASGTYTQIGEVTIAEAVLFKSYDKI